MELKETKEALQAIKEVAVFARKVFADGKVNLADLSSLVELGGKVSVLSSGLKDAKLALPELKDLSAEEAQELLALMFQLLKEVKEA